MLWAQEAQLTSCPLPRATAPLTGAWSNVRSASVRKSGETWGHPTGITATPLQREHWWHQAMQAALLRSVVSAGMGRVVRGSPHLRTWVSTRMLAEVRWCRSAGERHEFAGLVSSSAGSLVMP